MILVIDLCFLLGCLEIPDEDNLEAGVEVREDTTGAWPGYSSGNRIDAAGGERGMTRP